MYQFSDSDSVDSDEGIRYKTESIRNKKSREGSAENKRKRDSSSHRNRKRSRSRSRSRHRTDRTKLKERKKDHSPHDKSSRKTSKNRESERPRDRKYRRDKDKDVKENSTNHKDESLQREKVSSMKTSSENMVAFGPRLPEKEPDLPHRSKTSDDFPKSREDTKRNVPFGPSLPSKIEPVSKTETTNKEHSESSNSFGPQLPPHLVKEPTKENNVIGPTLPPHFITVSSLDDDSDGDPSNIIEITENDSHASVAGPVLPPHLLKKNENVIGPALPSHLEQVENSSNASKGEEDGEDSDVYGPVPVGAQYSQAHFELEERAIKMKMDQLDPSNNKQPVREEWMLTLPEAKAANFGLGPRQFRSKAGPDMSDRSSWTDTPEDKVKKREGKVEEKVIDIRREAELKQIQKRNVEQEKIAKRHKKEKDSLLEIHRKKLKNEKKNESGSSERRPFSREIDLQVNRFDEAQKKAVLKKAQLLDNRFSSGESKFL